MPIILHDDGGRLNELVSGQSEVILGLAGEGKCSFLWWCVVLKEQRSRLGLQVEEGAVGKKRSTTRKTNWNQDFCTFAEGTTRENKLKCI